MCLALRLAQEVCKQEKMQLEKKYEEKKKNRFVLCQKKLLAVLKEYATALTYIHVAHSPAFLQTKIDARKECLNIDSRSGILDAVKEQIWIYAIGFGWKHFHHPWSKGGVELSP